MKMKIVYALALMMVLHTPTVSAINFKEGTAVRVSNDTWMYISTTEYGNEKEVVTIPVVTAPSWKPRVSSDYLQYNVLLSGKPFAGLDTSAIVLSDAPLKDNQYVIPAGKSYTFMFFALVKISDEISLDQGIDLSLEIESK